MPVANVGQEIRECRRLLLRAELALSLKPIVELKPKSSAPSKINLVCSLTNLLVSNFALGSLYSGFLRDCLLHLRCLKKLVIEKI